MFLKLVLIILDSLVLMKFHPLWGYETKMPYCPFLTSVKQGSLLPCASVNYIFGVPLLGIEPATSHTQGGHYH